jgi:hypothetical protein
VTLAQTNAVVTRTQTIVPLASKTFKLVAPRDAQGKLPMAPYAVWQPSDGASTQERFTGGKSTMHPRYVLHVVGASYDNAQTVLELIKAKFIDANGFGIPLIIAGESCRNLRWESVQGVQVDDDVTPPLIYATAEITWDAEPTT